MPRIPDAGSVERARQPRDPGVRVPANAFGEQIGQAAGNLAETAGSLAVTLLQRRQGAEDDTFVTEYQARLNRESQALFEERKSSATEGAEGFAESLDEALNERADEIAKNLRSEGGFRPSSEAVDKAREIAGRMRARYGTRAAVFENNARVAKFETTLDDAIDQHAQSAFAFPEELDDALDALNADLDRAGSFLTPQALAQKREDARRRIARAAAEGFIGIDPVSAKSALQDGEFDEALPVEDKATLVRRADQAIARQEAETERARRAAAARLRTRIEDDITSISATGQGVEGIRDRAKEVLEPEDFERYIRRRRLAQHTYDAYQALKTATPAEMQDLVTSSQPVSGQRGFADKQDSFESLQKAARTILQQRAEDPAGYAEAAFEEVGETISTARENLEQLESALSFRLEAQADMGIPARARRVLSNDEAMAVVAELQAAPPNERAARFQQLQVSHGRHFDRAFLEMTDAGLDPQTAVLGAVAGDSALSQTVAQVIEIGPNELSKGLEDVVVSDIRRQVADELAEFRQVFEVGDFTGGATAQINGIIGVVQDLAVHYYRQTNDEGEAATRAVDQIINDRFHVVDSGNVRAYLPTVINQQAVDVSAVERTADLRQQRELIAAFNPVPFESAGAPDFLENERTISAAVNSGFWVTNETNDGLVLMVPFDGGGALPLVNAEGERYELDLIEASASARAPAEPVSGITDIDPGVGG